MKCAWTCVRPYVRVCVCLRVYACAMFFAPVRSGVAFQVPIVLMFSVQSRVLVSARSVLAYTSIFQSLGYDTYVCLAFFFLA